MNEQALIGWLCIARMQFRNEHPFHMPDVIQQALTARGWLTEPSEVGWDGFCSINFTPAGEAVCDMNDPEWAIEYEETEVEG